MPRLFTPPLVTGRKGPCGCGCALTAKTSLGFDVLDFAENVLLMELLPWQRWLFIHALELLPDGMFRFRKVIVLIARQNGKSTMSVVLALWALYRLGIKTVLGTAQDLDTAQEVWERAVDLVEETDEDDSGNEFFVRPQLAAFKKRVVRVNGSKSLILTTKARYKVKAANRSAGRGLSGDLVLLDELREHTSWAAWAAITKTTTARPNAQVWCLSNAGDASSVVLRSMRLSAHEELGDPDGEIAADRRTQREFDLVFDEMVAADLADEVPADETSDETPAEVDFDDLFLAEWSAPPGCDVMDRDGWAMANPSLGYLITERTILSDARKDPEWVFRTETLCQWPRGSLSGPFPASDWEETTNHVLTLPNGEKTLAPKDRIDGQKVATVAVSHDRSRAHVLFSGHRRDGLVQTVLVATFRGVDGVRPWLVQHAAEIEFVTGQDRGAPESPLLAELKADPLFRLPVRTCGGQELVAAYGTTLDLVRKHELRHNPQPVLDVPAGTAATRDLGGGKVVDVVRSQGDASPVAGFVIGTHMCTRPKPPPPPPPAKPALRRVQPGGVMTVGF